MKGIPVLLDTATDLVAFNSMSCKTCSGPKVELDKDSFTIRDEKFDIKYGTQWITGSEAKGTLCWANGETCAEDFSFVSMSSQKVFGDGISGIVGLARPRPFLLSPYERVIKDHFFLEVA